MSKKTSKNKKCSLSGSHNQTDPYALPPGNVFYFEVNSLSNLKLDEDIDWSAEEQFEITKFNVHHWPDYFTINEVTYPKKKGLITYSARLDGRLARKFDQLKASLKNEQSLLLVEALKDLHRISPSELANCKKDLNQVFKKSPPNGEYPDAGKLLHDYRSVLERVFEITDKLKNALGPDLHTIKYYTDSQQNAAFINMIKNLTDAVTAYKQKDAPPKAHRATEIYLFKTPNGKEIGVPLPYIAIEVARRYVEAKLKLPKKQDLKLELIKLKLVRVGQTTRERDRGKQNQIELSLDKKTNRFWSDLFASAELSGLERAPEYSHPRYQRNRDL